MYATTKMVKNAASAAIRQYIATGPRAGSFHCSSASGMVMDGALMALLVLPVGIFGMLQVPQRAAAPDFRNRREIVGRRRGSSGPFERPRIPWIAAGDLAAEIRPKQVADEHQYTRGLKEHADGDDEIPDIPAAPRLVGIDGARHSKNAGNVHEVERQMESNDEEPEVQFAERLAVHSSGHLRKPIIEGPKEREENTAHDDVMKGRDDEVRISE